MEQHREEGAAIEAVALVSEEQGRAILGGRVACACALPERHLGAD